jgi:hypothetical protein
VRRRLKRLRERDKKADIRRKLAKLLQRAHNTTETNKRTP